MNHRAPYKTNCSSTVSSKFPRIYLAGPEVFLQDAMQIANRKKSICTRYGFEGIFPMDVELENSNSLDPLNKAAAISAANERLMRECALLVANLTPFRGVSADVGTVYELGFMRGLGKPVFGYTNISTHYKERVTRYYKDQGCVIDPYTQQASIEDFGLFDNLMIAFALCDDRHLVQSVTVAEGEELLDLTGFEQCLRLASEDACVEAYLTQKQQT